MNAQATALDKNHGLGFPGHASYHYRYRSFLELQR